MIPNTAFNVATLQVSKLLGTVAQIEGYFRGATADRWLQLHDSCVTPVTGSVPIWQIPIAQTSQFFENLQVNKIYCGEGIFIGVSTTEGTWTASADTMDVTVFTVDVVRSATVVGDLTTGVAGLDVWADSSANSANKLARLQVINGLGVDAYLQVFGASPSNGDTPIWTLPLTDAATEQTFNFSIGGFPLLQVTTANIIEYGCFVRISSTPQTLTGVAASSNIQATYV